MFRQQLSNLSRLTSSTIKYAASSTGGFFVPSSWSLQEEGLPSQQLIDFWVADTQRGLDALLNDQFDLAEEILSQHASVSPFHAIGFALMAYVEAMLAFDTEQIKVAMLRIAAAEEVARQLGKRVRGWRSPISTNSSNMNSFDPSQPISISFASTTEDEVEVDEDSCTTHSSTTSTSSMGTVMTAPEEPPEEHMSPPPPSPSPSIGAAPASPASPHRQQQQQRQQSTPSPNNKGYRRSIDLLCELIEVNCMLMSATIQFLGSSWIEYMKGTYRLRKAYKMYEHLFEVLEGQKTSDYAAMLRKQKTNPRDLRQRAGGNNENKRFSFFGLPSRKASMDHLRTSIRRRSLSSAIEETSTTTTNSASTSNTSTNNNTLRSGVFFGIGLFSLIFSLLPPRVNRILNTLGFHSSRPFALDVLKKSYESSGLYSSLSALTLLIYYTNLTLFIHPRLFPRSISPESARNMLADMITRYPNNKIWELLEGKLCKMEGKPRRGVEILRDSRRRPVDFSSGLASRPRPNRFSFNDLGQLQALAVYEMGWGQIFLGDYFQASETFFRLESINNWSRAFYHYIATCCMFANEQYDKAGMEFHQIPNILERKRQLGGRLLPNEAFAERKIRRWKEKAQKIASETMQHPWMSQHHVKERYSLLDGDILKQAVVVNPLWELIYLWNGIPQLTSEMLDSMKERLERCLEQEVTASDKAILHLLLGAVMRELGEYEHAEKNLQMVLDREQQVTEDRWSVPYAMYELAVLRCFRLLQEDNPASQKVSKIKNLVRQAEHYFNQRRGSNGANSNNNSEFPCETSVAEDTHDWDSRLHIRCQLLLEKLDEFKTNM